MASLNLVILIGYVGQDPELRYTPSGREIAKLSIATSKRFTDNRGEVQERTTWHKVNVWGKSAEFVSKYVKKGASVNVVGELVSHKWQTPEGQTRTSIEINAQRVSILKDSKERSGTGQEHGPGQYDLEPLGADMLGDEG